ncbi:MAG: AMP-binding protein [Caulobacteraceae bacterium]|nr:AMP-binding protein [Caulobacteraceae bacterium]
MTMTAPDNSLWLSDLNDAELVGLSLGDGLRLAARRWGQAEAAVCLRQPEGRDVRWTFAVLDQLSERLAGAVLGAGFAPGERVAIWAPNDAHWILLEYALAKAGVVIVAIDPLYKRAELTHALNTAGVVGVFHADEAGGQALGGLLDQAAADVPTLRAHYSLTEGVRGLLEGAGQSRELPIVDPRGVMMIQYTSGTTGAPKAAQLSHEGVGTVARNSYRCWGFGAGDRVCHGFPLFHVGGSGNSTPGSMYVGAASLPLYTFKAEQALDILEQERCTGFIGVPTMLTAMLAHPSLPGRDLSALRCIVIGGAPVAPSLLAACEAGFGAKTCNGYGQTETSGVMTSTTPDDAPERKSQTCGRALPGVSLKVLGPDGRLVCRGEPGELHSAGPGSMLGYLGAGDGPGACGPGAWINTGDLAVMDDEGYVRIVGRTKEMIIRGGENLYPAEIEKYLLDHPDVAEVAVIGVPDPKYGEELCAVLRLHPGAEVTPEAFRAWCLSYLSRWKAPRYVTFVDAMPMTPSGKIRKHELKALIASSLITQDA